jgi:hypothetical protein
MDRDAALRDIIALHGSGRLSDAHNLAQEASKSVGPDGQIFQLLHALRLELLANRQIEVLSDLGQTLRRQAQCTAQLLVRDILKDPKFDDPKRLERSGYSVASQNEEDGMLMEVFRRIGATSRTFFEFGVGNGRQNITLHALLNGWRGWWIEINPPKVKYIRRYFAAAVAEGRLTVDDTPIDAENINERCRSLGIPAEIDLLSIDIDGNDFHVYKALNAVQARVVVLEYNPLYPPPMNLVGAYDKSYSYNGDTYIGASLTPLTRLAESKGYQLVGTSISGINAIFVRKDLAGDKFASPATPEHLYNPPRYQLSYLNGFGAGATANFGPLGD